MRPKLYVVPDREDPNPRALPSEPAPPLPCRRYVEQPRWKLTAEEVLAASRKLWPEKQAGTP